MERSSNSPSGRYDCKNVCGTKSRNGTIFVKALMDELDLQIVNKSVVECTLE